MRKIRPYMFFGYKGPFTTATTWISYALTVWAVYLITQEQVSPSWLLLSVMGIFCLQMGVTVGLHRLFSHRAFRCSKYWESIIAYWATLGIYGSTIQWAGMHVEHHKHSDTDRDPMLTHWSYMLWQRNRNSNVDRRTLMRLWRSPLHRFLHNYYALVILVTCLALYLISPWALLFGYAVPLAWYHWVSSWHTVLSHGLNGPRNLSSLEFVMFTGGEWGHLSHHQHSKRIKFDRFDVGYHFIKFIKL